MGRDPLLIHNKDNITEEASVPLFIQTLKNQTRVVIPSVHLLMCGYITIQSPQHGAPRTPC